MRPEGANARPSTATANSTTNDQSDSIAPKSLAVRPRNQNPSDFWGRYFRNPEANENSLLVNLSYYRSARRFDDVESILRYYLHHHGKDAQPWMYEMLAVAMMMNKGQQSDVNTALNYAARLAIRDRDPHELTRLADTLAIHRLNQQSGKLLDLALEIDPSNATALLMSMTLAERTEDPDRMAAAAEQLLALGWPGIDEAWRTGTRQRTEALAKALREAGRNAAADSLLDQLAKSEARDLYLRLTWAGDADLSLIVDEPLGATARVATPRTVFGGALLKNGFGGSPEEVYVCPRAFDGKYTIHVETIQNNPNDPARDVTLEIITHEGTDHESVRAQSIDLRNPEPIVVNLENGRRQSVLPYQAPPPVERIENLASPPEGATPGNAGPSPVPTISASEAANALRAPGPESDVKPR